MDADDCRPSGIPNVVKTWLEWLCIMLCLGFIMQYMICVLMFIPQLQSIDPAVHQILGDLGGDLVPSQKVNPSGLKHVCHTRRIRDHGSCSRRDPVRWSSGSR